MPEIVSQTHPVDKNPEKTLAANLHWLMANSADFRTAGRLSKAAKVDQKTIWRILNQANAPTLDKLTAIASAFRVETWQLLAPRLGADLYRIDADRRIVPVQEEAPPVGHQAPAPLTDDVDSAIPARKRLRAA
ncbi:MAG: helix-turn-helix transcriptional regulator [Rubrivivax sp.]|nr:helix-turn-helix transcriptional regulator [Rubrivivax sp.]